MAGRIIEALIDAAAIGAFWFALYTGFSTYPFSLDETQWSEADRTTWSRLRDVCFSVNSRIRNAGRRTPTAKLHYGQYA